jgi:hypothetical protein
VAHDTAEQVKADIGPAGEDRRNRDRVRDDGELTIDRQQSRESHCRFRHRMMDPPSGSSEGGARDAFLLPRGGFAVWRHPVRYRALDRDGTTP